MAMKTQTQTNANLPPTASFDRAYNLLEQAREAIEEALASMGENALREDVSDIRDRLWGLCQESCQVLCDSPDCEDWEGDDIADCPDYPQNDRSLV